MNSNSEYILSKSHLSNRRTTGQDYSGCAYDYCGMAALFTDGKRPMTDHLDYFALFYVAGIIVFGILMRLRYRRRKDKNIEDPDKKQRVHKTMARRIQEDAMSHRRERGMEDDS